MKKFFEKLLWISIGALIFSYQTTASARTKHIIPKYIAGITVLATDDQMLRDVHGVGLQIGHDPSEIQRYYVDPKKAVTLHTTNGTDSMVWEVVLSQGINLPKSFKGNIEPLVSRKLTINSEIEPNIYLMDSSEKILSLLGIPDSVKIVNNRKTMEYNNYKSGSMREAAHEAVFEFSGNRLIRARIYSGD